MKRLRMKLIALLLAAMMIAGCIPQAAKAAEPQVIVSVNIYVNNALAATDTLYDYDDGIWSLEYGSLPVEWLYGDAYGSLTGGTAYFNGVKGYFFNWGGDPSIFKSDFSGPTPDDEVVVNLFFEKAGEEAPVVYGSVTLNISDGRNPAAGITATLTGKKGADRQTMTITSGEDGIAFTDSLDTSYEWSYELEGFTYLVDFDANNSYYSDHVAPSAAPAEPEPEPDPEPEQKLYTDPEFAGEEYTVSVTHAFKTEAGGVSVDGHPEGATEIAGKTITLHPGDESILGGDLFEAVGGEFETIEAGKTVRHNGDVYRHSGSYLSGGCPDPAIGSITGMTIGQSFTMIRSDITVILSYTLEVPTYNVTMNYVDEEGNELAGTEIRSFTGSTTATGAAFFDVTGFEPGFYAGYKVVEGYTYDRAEGDGLTGEMDADKTVNFIFTKDAEEEIPADEPTDPEEPKDVDPTDEPADEPTTEDPTDEPTDEEPAEAPTDEPTDEEPEVVEPEDEEPEAVEPEEEEPEAVEPEEEEPETVDPEEEEPEAVEPEDEKPDAVEPEEEEPEAVEPEEVEPEAVEPEEVEPEAVEPEDEEPAAVEPEAEEPAAVEPEAEEPQAEEPQAEEPQAEETDPAANDDNNDDPAPILLPEGGNGGGAGTDIGNPDVPNTPSDNAGSGDIAPMDAEVIPAAVIPAVSPAAETPAAAEETLEDDAIPLAASAMGHALPTVLPKAAWALVNLLLTLATLLLALVKVITFLKGRKEEEQESEDEIKAEREDEEDRRKRVRNGYKLLTIIPAALAVIIFILTENMRNPMILVDRWTLLMLLVFAINAVLALITKEKKQEEEEEEEETKAYKRTAYHAYS